MSISRCEEDVAKWDRCDQQSDQNKNDLVKFKRP